MNYLTTGQVARKLNCDIWQFRRIFEEGILPEPGRFGGKWAIPEALVPKIKAEMDKRGWGWKKKLQVS